MDITTNFKVRGISEELLRRFKSAATLRGVTASAFAIEAFKMYLEHVEKEEGKKK